MRYLILVLAVAGCGKDSGKDEPCEMDTGTWDCVFTVETATGNCDADAVGMTIDWSYVVTDSDDRKCRTEQVNEGPVLNEAEQLYYWWTGSSSATADNKVEGEMTYRLSEFLDGSDACVLHGPLICRPR